jgi:hypothetical protein
MNIALVPVFSIDMLLNDKISLMFMHAINNINNKTFLKKYFCYFEGYHLCLTNVRIK